MCVTASPSPRFRSGSGDHGRWSDGSLRTRPGAVGAGIGLFAGVARRLLRGIRWAAASVRHPFDGDLRLRDDRGSMVVARSRRRWTCLSGMASFSACFAIPASTRGSTFTLAARSTAPRHGPGVARQRLVDLGGNLAPFSWSPEAHVGSRTRCWLRRHRLALVAPAAGLGSARRPKWPNRRAFAMAGRGTATVLGLQAALVFAAISAAGSLLHADGDAARPYGRFPATSESPRRRRGDALRASRLRVVSRRYLGILADESAARGSSSLGVQTTRMIGFLLTRNGARLFAVSASFGLGFSGIVPAYVLAVRECSGNRGIVAGAKRPAVHRFGNRVGGWLPGAIYNTVGSTRRHLPRASCRCRAPAADRLAGLAPAPRHGLEWMVRCRRAEPLNTDRLDPDFRSRRRRAWKRADCSPPQPAVASRQRLPPVPTQSRHPVRRPSWAGNKTGSNWLDPTVIAIEKTGIYGARYHRPPLLCVLGLSPLLSLLYEVHIPLTVHCNEVGRTRIAGPRFVNHLRRHVGKPPWSKRLTRNTLATEGKSYQSVSLTGPDTAVRRAAASSLGVA